MAERITKLQKEEGKKNQVIAQNRILRPVHALYLAIREDKRRKTNYVPSVAQHISLLTHSLPAI